MFKRFLLFGLACFLVFSCKKDTSSPVIPFAQQSFSFNARIGNNLISYSDSAGVYNTASRIPASAANKYLEEQSSTFTGSIAGVTVNAGINLYEYFPTEPSDTVLNTMFSTGNYQYWNPNAAVSGVEIFWFDGVKTWSTAYGKADQSQTSSFTITNHIPNTSSDTTYKYITAGNATCILYDGQGNSVPISYSAFKLKTNKY